MGRKLVNRFFAWMEEGLDRDAYAAAGRFLVFMGLGVGVVVVITVAIVAIASLFAGEPACDSGSHRWHTTVGKTTTSKCVPDKDTGL